MNWRYLSNRGRGLLAFGLLVISLSACNEQRDLDFQRCSQHAMNMFGLDDILDEKASIFIQSCMLVHSYKLVDVCLKPGHPVVSEVAGSPELAGSVVTCYFRKDSWWDRWLKVALSQ